MTPLHLDTTETLQLNPQDLIGRCVGVLGISGSGKTNTAAVLVEELLSSGIPLTIVDPEGEYWGLKEKYEVLIAGRSDHADVEFDVAHAGSLAELSVLKAIPVILDLSEFGQDEMYEFLLAYFTTLWEVCLKKNQPYQVFLEEAHEFLPQNQRTPLKEILTRIALRGRKRGLGTIVISQRSAKVDKDVLSQASLLFLHRVVHPIDLKIYQEIIPLPGREVETMVGSLAAGHAIVLYEHQAQVAQIRLRHTLHAGATPLQGAVISPELKKIDNTLLEELRRLMAKAVEPQQNREETKLARRVQELETELAAKNVIISAQAEELERLQTENTLLSKLQVSLDGRLLTSTPSTLEVQEAWVGKLVTNGVLSEVATTASSPTTRTLPLPPASDAVELLPQERSRLDTLLRKLRKLPKPQLAILHLLVQHNGSPLASQTISIGLGMNRDYLSSHPPTALLDSKLVTRRKGRSGYLYRSNVEEIAKAVLPRLVPSSAAQLILERLK